MNKILALMKKDWLLEWSYPFAALSRVLTLFGELLTFYFVSRLVAADAPGLPPSPAGYFGFAVVGLAYGSLFGSALYGLSSKIQHEQLMGTLESLLSTPTPFSVILAGLTGWTLSYAMVEMTLYLGLAIGVFGVALNLSHLLLLIAVTALSLTCFLSIGWLGAAWILRFKRGDPASWAVTAVSSVMSGVFFPVTLFPEWLQPLAALSPLTHTLNAARALLLEGRQDIGTSVGYLLVFTILACPAGLWALNAAHRSCRSRGLLGTY